MVDWRDKAACAECDDPEIFFEGGVSSASSRFCQRCEARTDCLDFAIKNAIDYGVWGGKFPHERLNESDPPSPQ